MITQKQQKTNMTIYINIKYIIIYVNASCYKNIRVLALKTGQDKTKKEPDGPHSAVQ